MISNSDEALFGLACLLSSSSKGNREREAIATAAKLFDEYFKEFGGNVDEHDYDLELLLRCVDESSSRLILYIQQLPNQTRPIAELTERLYSTVSIAERWDLSDKSKYQSIAKIFAKNLKVLKEKKGNL